MGAPTSAVISEAYIQNMECKQIFPILVKHQLIGYFRYVDDILIIYDQAKTNIDQTLVNFNEQQPTIKFTIEKESQNSINFLDLTVHCNEIEFEFEIYRKPTQTDIIIPHDSCHPREHKMSSMNYLLNRLNRYPITNEAKEKELNIIKNTLHNSKYSTLPPGKNPFAVNKYYITLHTKL
jgi:hypothetical protein